MEHQKTRLADSQTNRCTIVELSNGALIGGLVGATALPFFSFFHRLLKHGDQIENRYFLPLSIGTTAIIVAFILGL